jgi:hypothetical protein
MIKAILINPKYHTCGETLYVWHKHEGYLMCSWTLHGTFIEPFVLKEDDVKFIEEK